MKKQLALTLAMTGLLGGGSANALIIDHFDGGTGELEDSINPIPPASFPTPLNIAGPSSTTLGGSRTIALVAGGTQNGTFIAVNRPPNLSLYGHSQIANSSGYSSVTWNANGAGLANVDLTEGGLNDALQLNVKSIDQGTTTLTFDITSTAGIRELILSGLSAGPHAFLFSAFTGSGTFDNVTAVKLTVAASSSSDLTLDLIQTRQGTDVPVPGTLALLGLGLLLPSLRRRKAA